MGTWGHDSGWVVTGDVSVVIFGWRVVPFGPPPKVYILKPCKFGVMSAPVPADARFKSPVVRGGRRPPASAKSVREAPGDDRRRDVEKLEAELAIHKARLEETQKLAHLGSWEWDVPRNEVLWTDELYRLYGFEPGTVAVDYESYLSYLHPDDRDRVNQVVQSSFATGESFDFEHRLVRPNGEVRWLHGRGEVELSDDGKAVRMYGTALDITERKASEEAISRNLHEKEVLLRELHHRVKNNLQVIASLLNLQAGKLHDAEASEHLRESRDRVRSMALVHETLYQSETLSQVDFRWYIERLMGDLRRSHGDGSDRVRLALDLQDTAMDVATATHAGLLVNELVSNAYKHAFPGGRRGEVTVRLVRAEGGGSILEVSDDGVGMNLDALHRPGALGLQLVQTFTEQLGGSIEREDAQPGTRYRIRLPAAAILDVED